MTSELTEIANQLKEMNTWGFGEWLSLGAIVVSLISTIFFVCSLKVSREQNKISNSNLLKDSYKTIINQTVIIRKDNKDKLKNYLHEDPNVSYEFNRVLSEWIASGGHCISPTQDFLDNYSDMVDVKLLDAIASDNNLKSIHKYELIIHFGKACKFYDIQIEDYNNSTITHPVFKPESVHPIFLKYNHYHDMLNRAKQNIKYVCDYKFTDFIKSERHVDNININRL